MARAFKISPGRWGVVVVIVLMGAALALTAWSTNSGVREASQSLIHGQADMLHRDLRAELAELPAPPGNAELTEILSGHADDGLLYLATLDSGNHIQAEAGSPVGQEEALTHMQTDTPVVIGGRVCVIFRGGGRRHWQASPGVGRMAGILVEMEPRQADQLRAEAARTLEIGALAAGMLLVMAVWLIRNFMRRAELERELERDRRLASLGQLSAVLAHEIRNPLASLKGNAQLLAAMLAEGEKPRQKADRVVSEAVRLEGLTNDLLEFARTGELHREAVDPAALVNEVAAGRAEVIVDTRGAPPTWSLDRERVRQVLQNVIDNAIQAGPPVAVRVFVQREGDGKRLVIEIQDRGAGVPAEESARIFEPFFTKKIRGTGLGLAVAKRVIDLHGGAIVVENAPPDDGGGALFRITLPEGH